MKIETAGISNNSEDVLLDICRKLIGGNGFNLEEENYFLEKIRNEFNRLKVTVEAVSRKCVLLEIRIPNVDALDGLWKWSSAGDMSSQFCAALTKELMRLHVLQLNSDVKLTVSLNKEEYNQCKAALSKMMLCNSNARVIYHYRYLA